MNNSDGNTPEQRANRIGRHPAFPSGDGEYGGGPTHATGLTKREHFAITIYAGFLAGRGGKTIVGGADVAAADTRDAIDLADALLLELAR